MAIVSSSFPSEFHIFPPFLANAAIDASTITSEETWKFVIPLSLFTIAILGPLLTAFEIACLISTSNECPAILLYKSCKP